MVSNTLKAYIAQRGKITSREVTQAGIMKSAFKGIKVSEDQKDILINALISYSLVRPTKARGGLKARSQKKRKAARQKRKEKKGAEKTAAPPEALQEVKNKQILDRWHLLAGIKK